MPDARFRGQLAQEENWSGAFVTEVKSGQIVRSLATRFREAEAQAGVGKAIGDPRPFMFVAMPKDWGSEGLVTVRLSVYRSHIAPYLP